jgi:hypothetical protein
MKSIIEEITDWRVSEIIAGRNPTEIRLSEDQRRRLKEWCESNQAVFIAPDGSERRSNPTPFYEDMVIFGMKVISERDDPSKPRHAWD